MKYEYTENTLKIARFMGITPIKGISVNTGGEYYYYNNLEFKDYDGLPFYNTWDELMPVVIKIESFGGDDNELDIFGNCVQLGDMEFVGETKLDAVYEAVVFWVAQHHVTIDHNK